MSISPTNKPMEGTQFIPPDTSFAAPLQNTQALQALMMDSTSINLMSTITTLYHDKKNYEGEAGQPKLIPPTDGKTPPVVEPAVQNIVSGFIAKEITMLLAEVSSPSDRTDLFNHLTKGAPLQNPKLTTQASTIKKSVEESVRQEARLENFTLTALYQPQTEAWVQTPLTPYSSQQKKEIEAFFETTKKSSLSEFIRTTPNLTPKEISQLQTAVEEGKVDPKIKPLLTQFEAQVIQVTQEKYALPISWRPGTTEVDKWKPVNQGIVNPRAIGQARAELVNKNVDEVSINYFEIIIDALYSQKEVFNKQLALNTNMLVEQSKVKEKTQDQRDIVSDQKAEDVLKSQRRADKLEVLGKVVKIGGAVLSVVAITASILTAGMLAPVTLALIAVTAAVTTIGIVGSQTGATQKVFEAVNEFVNDLLSDLPDALATTIKVAAVVAVVVVVALLVIATGPAAGKAVGGVAIQALTPAIAKTVVTQATVIAMRQLLIQLTVMAIMGSGILTDIAKEAVDEINKALGNKMSERMEKALVMIIFITEIMVIMALAAKGTSSTIKSSNAPNVTPTPAPGPYTEATKVEQVLTQIKETLSKNPQLKKFFDELLPTVAGFVKKYSLTINLSLQSLNLGFTAVTSLVEAGFQSALYASKMDIAETEEAEAELQALIKSIDDAIKIIQSSSKGVSEGSTDLSKAISTLLQNIGATTTKLFNSYQG